VSPSLVARIRRAAWLGAALIAAVLIVLGVADRLSCPVAQAEGHTVNVTLTFYGFPDNTPPGRAIHHPGPPPRHSEAGGIGTYDNPTTVAGGRWSPGTRLYLPYLNKYLIVEDSCSGCSGNHIDVWVGGTNHSSVIDCEHRLTPQGTVPVEVDPPPGYRVSTGMLC
jgi:hypothetical protein